MKLNHLFPSRYKIIGWLVLVPSMIMGFITLLITYEPAYFDWNVPAIIVDELFGEKKYFGWIQTNVFNELCGVLVIIGSILVAFSKEKVEDEYITKIRLESLVWAIYFNYGILLVSFLFIFDMAFLWVMVLNMFSILIFFIIRFEWQLSKMNKSAKHEE